MPGYGQGMRLTALALLLLCPLAVMAGTRELSGGQTCGVCVFALCLGANGHYERCADPCAADVVVRLHGNDRAPERLRTLVGRGKKRTRLFCHSLGAPCFLCETDADCQSLSPPGTRAVCTSRACQYICPSGVVLEFP